MKAVVPVSAELLEAGRGAARRMCDFINASPSPYHAVATAAKMLQDAGFRHVEEHELAAASAPGARLFVTRNGSSLVAVAFSPSFSAAAPAARIVGAHTDSPCLKLKPAAALARGGYQQLSCQTYGGALWHTWLDRDLSVAGRLITRDEGGLKAKLVHLPGAVCRIPALAPHLQSMAERDALKLDKEEHLAPIICSDAFAAPDPHTAPPEVGDEAFGGRILRDALAEAAGVPTAALVECDLSLAPAEAAALGGLRGEFAVAPRIDNLASCWAATAALCAAVTGGGDLGGGACVVALFDHEEVGSVSAHGAGGDFLVAVLRGGGLLREGADAGGGGARRSFLVSADCAHLLNPNYMGKHQMAHRPQPHRGVVIKVNANQRYATTAATAATFGEVCRAAGVPVQRFCVSNESPCGSTIGPMASALAGIPTIDIGIGQLAMHSAREMCGVVDCHYLERALTHLFTNPLPSIAGSD